MVCSLGFVVMTEAYKMARREDNVERCLDKSSSSTSSEDDHSCENVHGVITWLKPVGEAMEKSFWSPMSASLFPPRGLILWTGRMMIKVE